MSDLKFNCPHCQQRLGIPEAAMGRTIPCPLCKGHIRLPAGQQTEPTEPEPTRKLRAIGRPATLQKDDVKFSCSACDVHIVIAGRAAGKQITCQRCGARIVVPGANPPPPPPAPAVQPETSPLPEHVDARMVPELIEKLRRGDEQAGKALISVGETVIPALVEGLKEYTLEEPDTNRGADYVATLLVKCGAVSVQPLIAKLGKSRHAYFALGRIGNDDAINALVFELSSCNWRRAELASTALGLVKNPSVLRIVDKLNALLKSTRRGEVYMAAGSAITALQNRFPNKVKDITRAIPVTDRSPARAPTTASLQSIGSGGSRF